LIIVYGLWYIKINKNRKDISMRPVDKKISVTFSIPVELNNLLHSTVDRRKLSKFVAEALGQALKEKKQALKEAYIEANKDPDRLRTIKEWEVLDVEDWDD
jgi:hypothetical protein